MRPLAPAVPLDECYKPYTCLVPYPKASILPAAESVRIDTMEESLQKASIPLAAKSAKPAVMNEDIGAE